MSNVISPNTPSIWLSKTDSWNAPASGLVSHIDLSDGSWSDLELGQNMCWKHCDGRSHVSAYSVLGDLSGPMGIDLTHFPISMALSRFRPDNPSDIVLATVRLPP